MKITERLGRSGLFAEVKWYHPEYIWIISERAEHIRHRRADKDFSKIGERLVLMDYGASRSVLVRHYGILR